MNPISARERCDMLPYILPTSITREHVCHDIYRRSFAWRQMA